MKKSTKRLNLRVVSIHTSNRGSPIGYGGGNSANKSDKQDLHLSKRKKRKRPRNITVGTWNIQGWNSKDCEVVEEFKKMNVDILVITETKKKGSGVENIDGGIHCWSGVNKEYRAKAGVGILIKKRYVKTIRTWEAINERVLKMNIKIFGREIVIIGLYAPTDDSNITEKEHFKETVQLSKIKSSQEIVIAGDLNGRIGNKDDDGTVGRFGEDTINDNGERLIELCEFNNLKIMNGFFRHKNIHKYTWTQETRKLRSIIDYVIIRKNTSIVTKDVRVKRGAECGTDHKLLIAKMFFPWYGKESGNRKNERKNENLLKKKEFKLDSLQDESIKDLYQRRLDQKLCEFRYDSVRETYEHMKHCIEEAAMEALGEKDKNSHKYKMELQTDTIRAIQTKKEFYERWLSTKTEDDFTKYREKNKEVRKLVAKEKNQKWEKVCSNIEQYIGGARSSESWKKIKSLKANRKERTYISYVQDEKWQEYYQNLLTEKRPAFIEQTAVEEISEREDIPIGIEELKKAIYTLKNNKASGPGNIAAELIKCGTNKMFRMIQSMFYKVMNGEELPQEWSEAYITSIFKKGDRRKCENYRGISVLATMGKLYGKILRNKLEDQIQGKIGEDQSGFTAGKSCLDHIYTLQQLIEKKKAKNRSVHLAFVDLKKAYDSVPRKRLWEAMEKVGVTSNIITAVKIFYKKNKAYVKINNRLLDGFITSKGLLQGCSTSPTLFKIFLENSLQIWKQKCEGMGVPIRNEHLFTLSFADDQVVIAQDEEDLSYMLRKLNEEYSKAGLEINFEKTKYLATTDEDVKDLQIDDDLIIAGTDKFRYLGFIISKTGTTEEDIKNRLGFTRNCIRQLNPILWDSNLTRNTKATIYQTMIQSIMTYGSEAWVMNKKYRSKIMAVEMEYWRRCCNVTRLDRIRNEEIRRRMGVENDVLTHIEEKRLQWYGHVRRASDSRWIHRVTDWSPLGRRKRGRPRRSWRNEVDEAMESRGLQDGEWEDRDEWRLLLREGRQRQL